MGSALKLINASSASVQYSESPFGVGGGGGIIQQPFAGGGAAASRNSRFEDYDKAYLRQVSNKPIMPDFRLCLCEL
jgi:thiol:disulfide interchange protein DsbD